MRTSTRRVKVAVLGAGTVGGATIRLLQRRDDVELVGVLVKDPSKPRTFEGWADLVTTDVAVAESAEVVVEVLGGTGLASDLALAALDRGATVVSANKASLAERWSDYLPAMRAGRVHFEAAVMAGTPVVGALAGGLRGCSPVSLQAVLNGTCNVILSAMETGTGYEAALAAAQAAGYAEADPTLDVEGIDAAHKLAILARLAFDPQLSLDDVLAATTGITEITAEEVAEQAAEGRKIRLLGTVVAESNGWHAAVMPLSLPVSHPLARDGTVNGLSFVGEPLGNVTMHGLGAGAGPTASAVVADVVAAVKGRPGPTPLAVRADHEIALGAKSVAGDGSSDARQLRSAGR